MLQYHQFPASLSLYPQQVSQELMAAFVFGKQYMQDVSGNCRLCIMPADISISRSSIVATLYYYLSQQSAIHRIIVLSASPQLSTLTLPSPDYAGIRYVLGKKILYDIELSRKIASLPGMAVAYSDDSLESDARYTHVHYLSFLPQQCTVLPVLCPMGDRAALSAVVDAVLEEEGTMVLLMDNFAFRPLLDEEGQQDMQTLIYEPGGHMFRLFNSYVSEKWWLFYALRVDKAPLPKDPDRYISLLMAG